MTCKHKKIRTWVLEDTGEPAGMWSCVECGLKFEPLQAPAVQPLTDEQVKRMWVRYAPEIGAPLMFARAIEAALKGDV